MKRAIQIVLSLVLSGFFVWLSLRGTHLAEVAGAIAHADLRWLAAYGGVLTVVHCVRVARWGLLLEPLAKISFRQLNPLGAVGFMALMVMPLRLGEFARPYLVADHLKVRKSAALASVVVERIVDGLTMAGLLVVLLWTLGPSEGGGNLARIRLGSLFVTLAFAGGLVTLILAFRHRETAARLTRRWVGRLSPRLAERLTTMLEAFIGGLRVIPSTRKVAEFFVLTAVYWGLAGLGLQAVARAFGFELTTVQALTVLGLQVIGSMIPAGPGMIGTIQFFSVLGISLFLHGEDAGTRAAAFAHTVWAMQFGQQVLFGLIAVGSGSVKLGGLFGRLRRGEPASDAPASGPA